MNNQKLDNQLNLALSSTEEERMRTDNLNVGYDTTDKSWQLIVRYTGSLERIRLLGVDVQELLGGYAILNVPERLIRVVAASEEILFVEKPKRLSFAVENGKRTSCINPVQQLPFNLHGAGCIVAIIDSGIDYANRVFFDENGNTRILELWDQSVRSETPPEGYTVGSLYLSDDINEALRLPETERYARVPSRDASGHGTSVASVAVGNFADEISFNADNDIGIATRADIIVVKLGMPAEDSFPRTTELMLAIDFCVRRAMYHGRPMAINLSFGNNYGSHDGTSLISTYIDTVATMARTVIVVGSGNEGASGSHNKGVLYNLGESGNLGESSNSSESGNLGVLGNTSISSNGSISGNPGVSSNIHITELVVGRFESNLNIQLWKSYADTFDVELEAPNGQRTGKLVSQLGAYRYSIGNTELLVYFGEPSPYSRYQEVFIEFLPKGNYIDEGVWRIILTPINIIDGRFDMWLPSSLTSADTRFLRPSPDTTLTIPSTATNVITVGAYDAYNFSYADFSGRGFTRVTNQVKPDIVAPGVNILCASPGGALVRQTGTSFATPFVTGSAALMMEWGIVKGNDAFLYGEKVKAYLIRGARRLPLENEYPNTRLGWGALCLRESLPV